MAHIEHVALKYCEGLGLDIGANKWPLPGALSVDNGIENAYNLNVEDESLDYIFSSHCFEHLSYPNKALDLWVSKIKPGGIIFLYLPHPDMVMWRINELHGQKHKWMPTPLIVRGMFKDRNMKIVEIRNRRDVFYSFYVIGRKK